jgi:DNA-3-methyladenine glycosylase II
MTTSFLLYPVPPFRLDLSVWALRRRQRNLIDTWDKQTYARVFIIDHQSIKVNLKQISNDNNPQILVSTHVPISAEIQNKLSQLLKSIFSLDLDMTEFYKFSNKDVHLKPLVNKFKGMKPPRFPSLFETLCNAVACQQLSLDAGISLLNNFSQQFGKAVTDQQNTLHAFPEPQVIKNQSPSDLKKLGFSLRKSETIILLAQKFAEPQEFLPDPQLHTDQEIISTLSTLKGIGRWSSEYALLRGLGRIHLFPQDDIGAQNNFQQFLHLQGKVDHHTMQKIIKNWYPYSGLIYFHLLLKNLDDKGLL